MPERLGVGIDVGATKILAAAVTPGGEVFARVRVPSPPSTSGLDEALVDAVHELCRALSDFAAAVVAVGLALPGLVEPTGILRAAPNLGAADVGIDLSNSFGEPILEVLRGAGAPLARDRVVYDNDATCAAYGEAIVGAAAGDAEVLVISFGTGIGAGIVSRGQILRGAHGFAGEIGHTVIDPNGPPCPCGHVGCWERFASGSGLAYLARLAIDRGAAPGLVSRGEGSDSPVRGEDVVAAAQEDDPGALAVVETFAHYVALGLVNAVEVLDPARIVLGGGLMQASEVLFPPIVEAYVAMNRPAQHREASDLVLATLGEEAAVIGAGLLGLDHVQPPAGAG